MNTPDLECRDLVKDFDDFRAVDHVSFDVPQGSFFSILGPSGCGKTTLLRMIAGFQEPSAGDLLIKRHCVARRHNNAVIVAFPSSDGSKRQ